MYQPGTVVFVRVSGEPVIVLSVPDGPLYTVRRAVETKEQGVHYVTTEFNEWELETFREKVARNLADRTEFELQSRAFQSRSAAPADPTAN